MKKLLATLALVPALAVAQDDVFWHPEAAGVALAGPEMGTACYYTSGTCTSLPCDSEWACESVALLGAKAPVYLSLPSVGPVKVFARWAYAIDAEGALVPMSRWMP